MLRRLVRCGGWGVLAMALLGVVGACSGESAIVGRSGLDGSGAGAAGDGPGDPMDPMDDAPAGVDQWVDRIVDVPDRCLPYELPLLPDGSVPCRVFATREEEGCACADANRASVTANARNEVLAAAQRAGMCDVEGAPSCMALCVCENTQAPLRDQDACRAGEVQDAGWCYVAPHLGLGDESLIAGCDAGNVAVRFLRPAANESMFLACSAPKAPAASPAPLGSPCVPSDELRSDFMGFEINHVVLDNNVDGCTSGLCIVQGFQGRVSCPYGTVGEHECMVPGSGASVTVPVRPQLVSRSPSLGATCTCRCDGPGDGPFCSCGAGQVCKPLIADFGIDGPAREQAGSYCVPDAPEPTNDVTTCADEPEACSGR